MIIELYGLPGSGKSTLARKFAKQINCVCISCNSKSEIFYYFFLGWIRSPKVFLSGLFFTLKHTRSIYAFWNFYCVRYAKYQKAKKYKMEIVVVDEGLLQNILSLPHTKFSVSELRTHLVNLSLSDMVIVFDLSPAKRRQHLESRVFQSRRKQCDTDTSWDATMVANAHTMKQVLRGNKKCYFVTDATKDEEILQKVRNISL